MVITLAVKSPLVRKRKSAVDFGASIDHRTCVCRLVSDIAGDAIGPPAGQRCFTLPAPCLTVGDQVLCLGRHRY